MKNDFHSHVKKPHFHKKGGALGFILKVRVFGTRKWPIGQYAPFCTSFLNGFLFVLIAKKTLGRSCVSILEKLKISQILF